MDITIQPIVTEKATKLTDKLNRYTFRVSEDANKYQIKSLVEQLYGVKVVNVNTCIVRGKTTGYKKAFITIGEGQTIDLYSNI